MSLVKTSRVLAPLLLPPLIVGCVAGGPESGPQAPPTPPLPVDLAVTGVTVVDVERGRTVRGRDVLIDDGRIVSVRPSGDRVAAHEVVDGRGRYLIPGLWDMHAHLRGNGMPEWITTDWMMPLILAHGVTGVRDMASDCDGPEQGPVCLDRLRALRAEVAAGERTGPRILALSSFQVNPPADHEVTEAQARGLVASYDERGADLIKVYQRLSPQVFRWIADEARRRGLAVAGHVPLRMTAAEASAAGLRSLEHARDLLFDCYPGAAGFRRTARSLDPATDIRRAMVDNHDPERCSAVFRTLVAHDTWYVPTHITRRMEAMAGDSAFRNDPRARWLPAAMWQAWNADADRTVATDPSPEGRRARRDFYTKGLEITGAAYAAGVRVLVGTDGGDSFAFPGSGLHDEMGELVKAGLSPAEALRAATLDAAEFLGLTDSHGTVAAGKRADMILLQDDPLEDIDHTRRIDAVIFDGRLLDRARLDAILSGVEEAAARPLRP